MSFVSALGTLHSHSLGATAATAVNAWLRQRSQFTCTATALHAGAASFAKAATGQVLQQVLVSKLQSTSMEVLSVMPALRCLHQDGLGASEVLTAAYVQPGSNSLDDVQDSLHQVRQVIAEVG